MTEICPHNVCTGCGACSAICPVSCISMKEDALGALHPVIDQSRCISCGLCKRKTPCNNPQPVNSPISCYLAANEDAARLKSASGGIGHLLARYYIEVLHGLVFSTSYDDSMAPVVAEAASLEEIEAFKGSKYVHSRFDASMYQRIRQAVADNIPTLFIGTPCQIAGLRSYIGNIDCPSLLTVDLLCHGTCPAVYLREETSHVAPHAHPTDIRFRGNDGHNFALSLWMGDDCVYSVRAASQPYLYGYLYGLTLRENCFSCPYAIPERVGDITLGDFIGVPGNRSCVAVSTPKGAEIYEAMLQRYPSLRSEPRPWSDRLSYRPSVLEPSRPHPRRAAFLRDYPRVGFVRAARRALRRDMLVNKPLYKVLHHWGHRIISLFK